MSRTDLSQSTIIIPKPKSYLPGARTNESDLSVMEAMLHRYGSGAPLTRPPPSLSAPNGAPAKPAAAAGLLDRYIFQPATRLFRSAPSEATLNESILTSLRHQSNDDSPDIAGMMYERAHLNDPACRRESHALVCKALCSLDGPSLLHGISVVARDISSSAPADQEAEHANLRLIVTNLEGSDRKRAHAIAILADHLPTERIEKDQALHGLIDIVQSFSALDHGTYLTAARGMLPAMSYHGPLARDFWKKLAPKMTPPALSKLVEALGKEGITPPYQWE